ncbi:MAG TPA: hypothetical protein VFY40_25270 [Blastocatellia bacterium]|nr:hypothetical protein [Blastocatellia bacterium]
MLKIAFEWETEDIPLWWSNAQQIFGADTWEESLERSRRPEQIDIAVLNPDQIYSGLITLVLIAPKSYEFFFSAPRKSDAELLALACFQVGKQLLIDDQTAERLYSWVCSRHRGAMRVNLMCGMGRDGLTMFKGRSHGRPLEWIRMTLTRERLLRLINVEEKATDHTAEYAERAVRHDDGRDDGNVVDPESVWLYDAARHGGHQGGARVEAAD